MDSSVEIRQAGLQVLAILLPGELIDARGRLPFQAVIAVPEQVDVHVVQQRGELHPFLATTGA